MWRRWLPAPPARCRRPRPSWSGWCISGPTTSRCRSDKLLIVGLAGGFEADAIRPNVLGRFEDLLLAAVRHPAMLLYLDQAQSIGPEVRGPACAGPAAARPWPQREPGARDPGTAHAGRAQRLHAGGRDRVRARAHRLDTARR